MTVFHLAQTEGGDSGPWIGLGDVFWLTILLVFLLSIIAALLRLRQRDKCLKLLDDSHVTYLAGNAVTMWGVGTGWHSGSEPSGRVRGMMGLSEACQAWSSSDSSKSNMVMSPGTSAKQTARRSSRTTP